MGGTWPCNVCPLRSLGFCGALLGGEPGEAALDAQPDWQDFGTGRIDEVVVEHSEPTDHVYVLCEGWASRFLRISDGRKQILDFMLTGEIFSSVSLFAGKLPYSVEAAGPVRYSRFKREAVLGRLPSNLALSSALGTACLDEQTRIGESMFALGQRSAEERIAQMLVGLAGRIMQRHVVRDHRYPFPLRQRHIAEMTGLTPVHVSRVLGTFRDRGLCRLSEGMLEILDPAAMAKLGAVR
jgi:CRP-like cAMP-binding protein